MLHLLGTKLQPKVETAGALELSPGSTFGSGLHSLMGEGSGRGGKDSKLTYYKPWLRPDLSEGQSVDLAFGVP